MTGFKDMDYTDAERKIYAMLALVKLRPGKVFLHDDLPPVETLFVDTLSTRGKTPCVFTKEQADVLMAKLNEHTHWDTEYRAEDDVYITHETEWEGETGQWRGFDIHTADGLLHVYAIGMFSWAWEEVITHEAMRSTRRLI